MSNRKLKIEEQLRELSAAFLNSENNGSSLLTVTRVELTENARNANIFFTVFPESYEKTALEFAKRKRAEFKHLAIEKLRIGNVPNVDFQIDFGEKNRQRIDSISNQSTT
ncbi:MAG: ribosome-binding factor A [Minisyncoccia bacterium]